MQIEQLGPNKWEARSTFEERHALKAAGFRWNPNKKVWWTDSAEKAGKLMGKSDEEIQAELAKMEADKKAAIEASRATDAAIDIPVPDGLAYLPYQRAGIAYASSRPCALIGDEMGLGKTIQGIGVINADTSIRRVLIICPASLKINWKRELGKWLTRHMTIGIANGGPLPAESICIINYDILKKHRDALRAQEWDLMIVDESHYLKNGRTQRTGEVFGHWDKETRKYDPPAIPARRRVYLTGTPIPNRPIELWPLLKSMNLPEFKSWKGYVMRYCSGHQTRFGWDTSGASHLDELQEKLRSQVMVRRLKKDVLTELPPKRRQVIELPPNGAEGIVNDEQAAWGARQDMIERLEADVELAKASDDPNAYSMAVARLREGLQAAFTEMSRLRHATALAKVPHIVEHVINAVESSGKIVLMGHHKDVLHGIRELLETEGIRCVMLTGDMNQADRQTSVDWFQNEPSVQVFLGTIGAAGVGITLTAASHVIFAELDWVPGNVSQAEDRCHRIGQHDSVLVQHLVLEGSLDANMARKLVAKQEVIDSALDKIHVKQERRPRKEVAASEGQTRDKIGEIAATLTPEDIARIHSDLRTLAGMCDGTRTRDGAGFNKIDVRVGHELAMAPQLTPRQAALGKLVTHKYRKTQLGYSD